MDVILGNVVLTAVLVVALILFVASAAALAQLYTLRLDQTLLSREASYVAQSIEELYMGVNNTHGSLPQHVSLSIPMPETLGGRPYTLSVQAESLGPDETNLTVTVVLAGTTLKASSSVMVGRCVVQTANPLVFHPNLTVEIDLAFNGSAEECSIYAE